MSKRLCALAFAARNACPIAAAVLFVGVAPAPAPAAIIEVYREIFPATAAHALSDEGWQVHAGPNAQLISSSISGTEGRPQNVPAVNSNPSMGGLIYGWGYFAGGSVPGSDSGSGIALAWTDEIGTLANIASAKVGVVEWYQGNKLSATNVRVALKIDGNWYASIDAFTNDPIASGKDFDTQAELKTLDVSTAQWHALTFDTGTQLSLDQSSSFLLPAGWVTGGGLYFEGLASTSTPRFDSYLITVPEPATLPMLTLGSLLGMLSSCRRRARNVRRHAGPAPR